MGMFDVQINRKIKLKKEKKDLFEFLKKQIFKNKEYENELSEENLNIKKSHLNTLLRYNLSVEIISDKKESTLQIKAELHDTLVLTILIVLAILLTYGLGVIFVVAFVYYQKIVAKKYITSVIENYQNIN
jgi:hypothetical protein